MTDDSQSLSRILRDTRAIAVVGLSDQPHRPSHSVARYLQQRGYRIVGVNPRHAGETILGVPVFASLLEVPGTVDLVDVFRRTEDVLPIAEQAVQIGAKCLWQQSGIANHEADALARAAGLDAVMDRCTKVEHARLLGGANG